MRLTITYIFKFKAQTKRELLKIRARIHKWFFYSLGQKVHMDLSMVKDNSLRKTTRKISILKSPFIHKKAWEHLGSSHCWGALRISFTATREAAGGEKNSDLKYFAILNTWVVKAFPFVQITRRLFVR